jgi:hypothetical protein
MSRPRFARLDGTSGIWTVTGLGADGLWRLENERTWCYASPKFVTFIGGHRSTDPVTSIEAAGRQTTDKVRTEHRVVLELLSMEPLTDFELAKRATQALRRPVKQTSIGVRRGELVRLGLVVDSGRKGVSDTGSSCIVWQLTNAGRQEVAA